jgi:hypothetical protein
MHYLLIRKEAEKYSLLVDSRRLAGNSACYPRNDRERPNPDLQHKQKRRPEGRRYSAEYLSIAVGAGGRFRVAYVPLLSNYSSVNKNLMA